MQRKSFYIGPFTPAPLTSTPATTSTTTTAHVSATTTHGPPPTPSMLRLNILIKIQYILFRTRSQTGVISLKFTMHSIIVEQKFSLVCFVYHTLNPIFTQGFNARIFANSTKPRKFILAYLSNTITNVDILLWYMIFAIIYPREPLPTEIFAHVWPRLISIHELNY